MKVWAGLLGMVLASTGAFAADGTDFSGKYLWSSDGYGASLVIQQKGCESLDATYDFGGDARFTRKMIFDGVKRPVQAAAKTLEGFVLKNGVILVDGEIHSDGKLIRTSGKIYLDSNLSFVEENAYFDENGQEIAHGGTKYVRQ